MPEKLRVGIIGRSGRGGYGHALDSAWGAIPETVVTGVADDNPEGLAAAKKRLNVDVACLDYREMLEKARPDIVAICPRWVDQHADMAIAAAEAGVHIYIEKPFVRTLKEADAVVAACERKGVKLAMAVPTRYSPRLVAIQRLIEDGHLGTILEYRGRGKEDRRGGAEDLWVLGTHVLDMIRGLAGSPKSCFATIQRRHADDNGDLRVETAGKAHVVEGGEGLGPLLGDCISAHFEYANGTPAYFSSRRNQGARPSRYGLMICGSKGAVELIEGTMPSVKYLASPNWYASRDDSQWQDVSSNGIGKAETLRGPEYSARHTLAIRDLISAIREDRQPLANVYESRGTVEMIMAIFESHRLGRPVNLPLENREHPLRMLTR